MAPPRIIRPPDRSRRRSRHGNCSSPSSWCSDMTSPARLSSAFAFAFAGALVAVAYAQAPQGAQGPPPGRGRGGPGYLKLFDSNMPFDAHNLAGIWSPNGNGFGGGGRCRDCGDRGYSFEFPEFTPAGQGAF